ncbi:hypothetical protein SB766_32315, partial [Pseudomonas sp. SIMBA_077]
RLLGADKRLEDLAMTAGGNAYTVICHGQLARAIIALLGLNCNLTLRWRQMRHRVRGIEKKVEQNLLKLRQVPANR